MFRLNRRKRGAYTGVIIIIAAAVLLEVIVTIQYEYFHSEMEDELYSLPIILIVSLICAILLLETGMYSWQCLTSSCIEPDLDITFSTCPRLIKKAR